MSLGVAILFSLEWNPQFELILNIAIAILLGGLIGLEREIANRPAGFRTHMLVAGAAALLVGLADVLAHRFTVEDYAEVLRIDPIRIVEAIITGVSFLGAGTIFRRSQDEVIVGLTTAASILLASAIGIAVALEQYILAIGVTILCLIVLKMMSYIEHRVGNSK